MFDIIKFYKFYIRIKMFLFILFKSLTKFSANLFKLLNKTKASSNTFILFRGSNSQAENPNSVN
jgi:hypothetical protein